MERLRNLPDWIIVCVWFILALLIFYSGHLYSNDTVSKIESARNLLTKDSFEVSGYHGAWGIPVESGKTYPHFSLGSILMMLPPVLVYEIVSQITGAPLPEFVQSVFVSGCNLLYTALSGSFIFILLFRLGKSKRDAFIFAAVAVFCSEMLQYSSTGWNEPAALCWGLLGFTILATGRNKVSSVRPWILWAACSFFASLIRIEFIVFFLSFLFVDILQNKREWKRYILPLIIIGSVIFAHIWFNYYRFGSPFNFGYFGRSAGKSASILVSGSSSIRDLFHRFFAGSYLITVYRTHISFGRVHWFWVCPLLLLLPPALFLRKFPPLILQMLIAAGIMQLVIVAMGANSWCWANRYLYTTFLFLLLPVFYIPFENKKLFTAFKIMCIIGFAVSLLSTLVNYHHVQEILVNRYGYAKAMWDNSNTLFSAPVWLHAELFPGQLVNTVRLIFAGNNLPEWESLRTECFDIWPVGMCGAGVNSFVAFGLWILLLSVVIFFIRCVVIPRYLNEQG